MLETGRGGSARTQNGSRAGTSLGELACPEMFRQLTISGDFHESLSEYKPHHAITSAKISLADGLGPDSATTTLVVS